MINLNDKIPNAESFTYGELIASNIAAKYNINNIPTNPAYWDSLEYLAVNCLQPARNHFGIPIFVSSGYRSPELNAHPKVKGSPTSFHSVACAADIDFGNVTTPSLNDLFTWLYHNVPFSELIAENLPNGWIHIALMKGRENERKTKYKLIGEPVKRASFEEIQNILRGI